jgi:predicted phage baseplate assembly protein
LPSLIGEEVAAPTQRVFTLEHGTYRALFNIERMGEKLSFADYANSAGFSIRFGDGEFGLAPRDGDIFDLRYRLGNGRQMNVTADTLIRFKTEFAEPPSRPAFIDAITNPLAAQGGRDAESMEQIKINVPEAYKAITYRAVRAEDYVELSERLDWVQKAGVSFRWTGSWPTVFVTPDPLDRIGLTPDQREQLELQLERVRQVGRETCVKDPAYANIDLEIRICVKADAYPGQVKQRVLRALFGDQQSGGFFDPDNFTFGTQLPRSSLMAAIQEVAGVLFSRCS